MHYILKMLFWPPQGTHWFFLGTLKRKGTGSDGPGWSLFCWVKRWSVLHHSKMNPSILLYRPPWNNLSEVIPWAKVELTIDTKSLNLRSLMTDFFYWNISHLRLGRSFLLYFLHKIFLPIQFPLFFEDKITTTFKCSFIHLSHLFNYMRICKGWQKY